MSRFSSLVLILLSSAVPALAQSPIAGFLTIPSSSGGVVSICEGETIVFFDSSEDVGPLATYDWAFGFAANPAGSSSSGPIYVTYNNSIVGTTVQLIVNNNNGSPPSIATLTVHVDPAPVSQLSLASDGSEFSTQDIEGSLSFTRCNSMEPQAFSFASNHPNSITQIFDWGDGTPLGDENDLIGGLVSHTYPIGDFQMVHTVLFDTGCEVTRIYRIFNGSAPVVTVSGSGQTTCIPSPFDLEIISNDVPIDYTMAFSDSFNIETFTTANDTVVSHEFTSNSCGAEYVISPSLPPIQNAFSVTLIAQNLCSANGIPTVVTLGPITISSAPVPLIEASPSNPVCISDVLTVSNASLPGQNVTVAGCSDSTMYYWEMEEPTGYSLSSGFWGDSNGATGVNYTFGAWSNGSDELELLFSESGIYHLWLHIGNDCGSDSVMYALEVDPFASVTPVIGSQTICSGDLVDGWTWQSSIPFEYIAWYAEVPDGIEGVLPPAGFGFSPLDSPDDWVLTNTTDAPLVVEIYANVLCTNSIAAKLFIEVMPEMTISTGDLNLPICSNVPFELEINSNVTGTALAWDPIESDQIIGEGPGVGNVLSDVLVNTSSDIETVSYIISAPLSLCPADPITVTISVLPEVNLPDFDDIEACSGDNIDLISYDLGLAGLDYGWLNSNGDIGISESGNGQLDSWSAPENDSGGPFVGIITIVATLFDCPSVEATFEVVIHPSPTSEFEVSPNGGLDCETGLGWIQAIPGISNADFHWTGPGIVDSTDEGIQVDEAGIYSTTLLDLNTGCLALFEVEVLPPTPMEIENYEASPPNCAGGNDGWIQVETNAGNDALFQWTPIQSESDLLEDVAAGIYTCVATNASMCSDTITVELVDFPVLEVSLVNSGDSECGEANGFIEVQAFGGQGGYGYHWEFGQNDEVISGIDEGVYIVEVTDAGSCFLEEPFSIDCYPLTPIIVNQLITPNGDDLNDVWHIENLHMYPDHELKVYNRWGNVVFEASPYLNDWGGTRFWAGSPQGKVPAATYYYLVDTHKKSQKPVRGFLEIQQQE